MLDQLEMLRGATEDVLIEIYVYSEEDDDSPDLVAQTSFRFVVTDYLHTPPFMPHEDFPAPWIWYHEKLSYLIAGQPGVLYVSLRGLEEGVQYAVVARLFGFETQELIMLHQVLLDDVQVRSERLEDVGAEVARNWTHRRAGDLSVQKALNQERLAREKAHAGDGVTCVRLVLPPLPAAGHYGLQIVLIDMWRSYFYKFAGENTKVREEESTLAIQHRTVLVKEGGPTENEGAPQNVDLAGTQNQGNANDGVPEAPTVAAPHAAPSPAGSEPSVNHDDTAAAPGEQAAASSQRQGREVDQDARLYRESEPDSEVEREDFAQGDHVLVVLVLSARQNFERRQAIRESWARGSMNVRFIVAAEGCAVPVDLRTERWVCEADNERQVHEDVWAEHNRMMELESQALLREWESYDDVVIVPGVEVYRNLPQVRHKRLVCAVSHGPVPCAASVLRCIYNVGAQKRTLFPFLFGARV